MSKINVEYLIIGGGILGSAVAYSLSKRLESINSSAQVALIDIDLEGEFSSTLKNAGGVRATWRNRANIELCIYSINFFEQIADLINFKQHGYYWLHNKDSWKEIQNNLKLYNEYGFGVNLYHKSKINNYLPFVDNLDGVSGLSVSRKAGLLDHYSLREFYRRNARQLGVQFYDRQLVDRIDLENGSVKNIYTKDLTELVRRNGPDQIRKVLRGEEVELKSENIFTANILINATGAWAPSISKLYGYVDNDVKPRRRQLELISCPELDLSEYGMIIDTSDIYFHKEGEYILVGYSNMDEPYGFNFRFDFYNLNEGSPFIELIWKPLWKRISKFEKLKFIRGWAGIYGETSDKSGYLGKVPGSKNIFEIVAHTGRGIMISYAAGEALTDLIIDGEFRDDLKNASDFERSRPNGPLNEQLHL